MTTTPTLAFWEALKDHLSARRRVFLALVVEHTRHSPGSAGARLFVSEDGTLCGTIGGGVMEHRLIETARERIRDSWTGGEIITLFHRDTGPGQKSGMHCAGSQTNLYYGLDPDSHLPVVRDICHAIRTGLDAGVKITASEISLFETSGGGSQRLLRELGGQWVYEERLLNRNRLVVMGSGHCGLALSRLMCDLGYDVTVFDTRRDLPTFVGNLYANRILVSDFREAGAQVPNPLSTPVIVMTTDIASDVASLLGALPLGFPFIGVMGSPVKIARIRKTLEEAGIPETTLASLWAPVGLPVGSRTPEEIAVSVAAQLLQWRNGLETAIS